MTKNNLLEQMIGKTVILNFVDNSSYIGVFKELYDDVLVVGEGIYFKYSILSIAIYPNIEDLEPDPEL